MAKVLDALARAQQERLRREQGSGPAPVGGAGAGEETAAVREMESVAPAAAAAAAQPAMESRRPVNVSMIRDTVVGAHEEFSPVAEQVRQIRTNLESVLADYESRPIVVTSPVPGDGKSLFSANLAWTLADNPQQRVLLIDADMRKPEQHNMFGLRQAPGLSEYLRGGARPEKTINHTTRENFDVMTAGRSTGTPTSILSTDRLPAMLDELRAQYTWIIFDTPPLLPVTDASVIGRLCAGLILVVRMGKTHRTLIQRAQDLLGENRLPVLGFVLNEFEVRGRENDYYHKYYAAKGKSDGAGE